MKIIKIIAVTLLVGLTLPLYPGGGSSSQGAILSQADIDQFKRNLKVENMREKIGGVMDKYRKQLADTRKQIDQQKEVNPAIPQLRDFHRNIRDLVTAFRDQNQSQLQTADRTFIAHSLEDLNTRADELNLCNDDVIHGFAKKAVDGVKLKSLSRSASFAAEEEQLNQFITYARENNREALAVSLAEIQKELTKIKEDLVFAFGTDAQYGAFLVEQERKEQAAGQKVGMNKRRSIIGELAAQTEQDMLQAAPLAAQNKPAAAAPKKEEGKKPEPTRAGLRNQLARRGTSVKKQNGGPQEKPKVGKPAPRVVKAAAAQVAGKPQNGAGKEKPKAGNRAPINLAKAAAAVQVAGKANGAAAKTNGSAKGGNGKLVVEKPKAAAGKQKAAPKKRAKCKVAPAH